MNENTKSPNNPLDLLVMPTLTAGKVYSIDGLSADGSTSLFYYPFVAGKRQKAPLTTKFKKPGDDEPKTFKYHSFDKEFKQLEYRELRV